MSDKQRLPCKCRGVSQVKKIWSYLSCWYKLLSNANFHYKYRFLLQKGPPYSVLRAFPVCAVSKKKKKSAYAKEAYFGGLITWLFKMQQEGS